MSLIAASCSTPEKHQKKGDMYFSHGEYYDAATEYKTAYSTTPRSDKEARGMRAFLMGECYRHINSVSKAEGAYRNAVRYDYVDTTTYFYLGRAQLMQGNYKAAQKSFEQYLSMFPGDKLAQAGLQSCQTGPEMRERGSTYEVHPVALFTSRRADYCPVLYGEKWDQLILTSTRPQATGDDDSGITGMKNGDLFYTAKDEKGKWRPLDPLQGSVNTAYDEGAATISPDGQTMYFTYCSVDAEYPRYAEIYSSSRSDATWSKPQKVEISSDTLSSYAHPAVSPDGKWLYFVSDMPGGLGGLDIWRAQMDGHGIGAIENLGEPINTPGNEMFPTFRYNGDLYFSSDGHPGMGGLDIFVAHPDTLSGKWSVEAMPSPVNSPGDDFGMTFEGEHNRGYFSSNRKNGRGWDHIYSFEKPEVVQSVVGWVYEQDGYELPQAVVYMVGDDGTNMKFGLRPDGSFEQAIKPGVKYVLLATCDGFLNYKEELTVDSSEVSTTDTLYFPLPSMNSPVLVRNVFYEFNSAQLTDASRQSLDRLVQLLADNANVSIELSSHCDYRGNELYNRRLSQHRAESVVGYLVSHGVDSARLKAVGYGKLRPKVVTKRLAETYKFLHEGDTLTEKYIKKLKPGQQDTCNALNRRTEFRVLTTTYGLTDAQGNIDSQALLAGKAGTGKAKPEPVVRVYIPTPAEAAAADGKPLVRKDTVKAAAGKAPAKKAAAKAPAANAAQKKAVAAKADTVQKAKPATPAVAKADTAKQAPAKKAAAAAAQKKTAPAKADTVQKAKAATPATAKVDTAKAQKAKADSAKAAKAKADSTKAQKAKTDSAKAARAKADSIKAAAVKESQQKPAKAAEPKDEAKAEKAAKAPKAQTDTAKATKATTKAATKAAKKKAKEEAKKKAAAEKAAKKKAKAAAKAKAKADKAKAKAATAAAKSATKTTAAAATTTTAAAEKKPELTVKKSRTATQKASSTSSRSKVTAKAEEQPKAETKKLTLKERKAIQDSIIAKAKADAEAEKAKKK